MSPRIRILPDHVANQIAAGEVVERPASVVKELVENSLDAGASRVEIHLRNGGKTEIRVTDDGSGMEREDALLALDRHATSKIREADDLRSISSFGFRGEAMPSIAAVSHFEMETAPGEGSVGCRVRVRHGSVHSVSDATRQRGTTVTVRSLFGNVPARAKFLRSARAETRGVSEAVVLLALTNLPVSFELFSNGRELLRLPPAGSLRERAGQLWGHEEAGDFLELEAGERSGEIRVGGLLQRPDAARARGGRRHLFVNGRPFRDPSLARAVDEAYRTTVAPDVRPSFVLYLAVPPEEVDVNVHPAKAEVRFREREAVAAAVRDAVRAALAELESTAPLGRPEPPRGPKSSAGSRGVREGPAAGEAGEPDPERQLAMFVAGGEGGRSGGGEGDHAVASASGELPAAARPELWQLHDRYILAATRDGLLVIDQHSAHERILYEETMRRFSGQQAASSQRLLFPITLRLSPEEYSAVEELASLLSRAGFEVEPFGERTVIVQAAPNPHPYFDAERCFGEMIRELVEGSPLVDSARNQHERIAKSLACKSAIKAGQPLSAEEMAELFDRLFATELPGHDVHGRPTIVRLTVQELDRRFGRS